MSTPDELREADSQILDDRNHPGIFLQLGYLPNITYHQANLPLVKWYRSTFYNMTILGLCNFSAPGIWGAMNSLGAGGAASPHLVNSANALTFCLMIVSCLLSSTLVHYIGIKGALLFGTYVVDSIFPLG
jgi:hypothetical protein